MLMQSPAAFVQYMIAESVFRGRYCVCVESGDLMVAQCLSNLFSKVHILQEPH